MRGKELTLLGEPANRQASFASQPSPLLGIHNDLSAFDRHIVDRAVSGARFNVADAEGVFQALVISGDSERGVLPVEARNAAHADKELRAGRVWIIGPRHREDTRLVQAIVEFLVDLVARSARASSFRTACLDDEARDHPMKDDTVVVANLREADDVPAVAWSDVRPQIQDDLPGIGIEFDLVIVRRKINVGNRRIHFRFSVGSHVTHLSRLSQNRLATSDA